MKSVKTLVKDIYAVFQDRTAAKEEDIQAFGQSLARKIASKLTQERSAYLRLSSIGQPCERKLWYSINKPEKSEDMQPQAHLKYLLGDIFEETLLFLAKVAGHSVTEEQKELTLEGIPGHKDATVDGVLLDCKSASPFGFQKFKTGLTKAEDAFGYLTQLDTYMHADNHEEGGFLAGNKVTGELTLDLHKRSPTDYTKFIAEKKAVVAGASPPPRPFSAKPIGKSGNMGLDTVCSYCEFKKTCWPGLRTFLYSNGPVFLTEVKRVPDVPEV